MRTRFFFLTDLLLKWLNSAHRTVFLCNLSVCCVFLLNIFFLHLLQFLLEYLKDGLFVFGVELVVDEKLVD